MSQNGELTGKKLEEKRKRDRPICKKKMEGYGHNIPVGW